MSSSLLQLLSMFHMEMNILARLEDLCAGMDSEYTRTSAD